jgi:hypothetical protein
MSGTPTTTNHYSDRPTKACDNNKKDPVVTVHFVVVAAAFNNFIYLFASEGSRLLSFLGCPSIITYPSADGLG